MGPLQESVFPEGREAKRVLRSAAEAGIGLHAPPASAIGNQRCDSRDEWVYPSYHTDVVAIIDWANAAVLVSQVQRRFPFAGLASPQSGTIAAQELVAVGLEAETHPANDPQLIVDAA